MEKMPYRSKLEPSVRTRATHSMVAEPGVLVSSDWRKALPLLTGKRVSLRELRPSDATSLFSMLTTEEVSRFISPPPATVEGFERFIAWTQRMRDLGTYACFAVKTLGVHRLEARASVRNGRGNGALRKIGAVQEGVLRRSFLRNGEYHDQVLWSILEDDWCRTVGRPVSASVH